jgi:hypothetical protein
MSGGYACEVNVEKIGGGLAWCELPLGHTGDHQASNPDGSKMTWWSLEDTVGKFSTTETAKQSPPESVRSRLGGEAASEGPFAKFLAIHDAYCGETPGGEAGKEKP